MITSKQNALIKEIRFLHSKKGRQEQGKYIVEGVKMVNEAFQLKQNVCAVVCTEKCLLSLVTNGFNVELVSEQVFESITDEKSPQGAIAVLVKPDLSPKKSLGSCLLLDGVSDPGNMGTIIRTMACAGYKQMYVTDDCVDPFSPKVVRSSMSGIFNVQICECKREEAPSLIGLPLVVGDMNGQNLFSTRINGDFCLVIGNEAHGVSPFIKERANVTVSIPMQKGMESLNAGVSAGILMYALKNQQ